jgi:hypothetical protein
MAFCSPQQYQRTGYALYSIHAEIEDEFGKSQWIESRKISCNTNQTHLSIPPGVDELASVF